MKSLATSLLAILTTCIAASAQHSVHQAGGYTYFYWSDTTDTTWSPPSDDPDAEVMIVGGGGGASQSAYGAGGGAGGLAFTNYPLLAASSYPVIVGAGGAGAGTHQGTNTTFGTLEAGGGGAGHGTAGLWDGKDAATVGGSSASRNGWQAQSTGGPGLTGSPAGDGIHTFNNVGGSNTFNWEQAAGGGGAGAQGNKGMFDSQSHLGAGQPVGWGGGQGGDGVDMRPWLRGLELGDGGWFAGGGGAGSGSGKILVKGGRGGGGPGGFSGNATPTHGMPGTGGGGGGDASFGNGGSGAVIVRVRDKESLLPVFPCYETVYSTTIPFEWQPPIDATATNYLLYFNDTLIHEDTAVNASIDLALHGVPPTITMDATWRVDFQDDAGVTHTGTTIPLSISVTRGADAAYVSHGYTYLVVTNIGDNLIHFPEATDVEVLIVAGGGGGGVIFGGGGGAGGLVLTNLSLAAGDYTATVGEGGLWGRQEPWNTYHPAQNGSNSAFNGVVAIGGGRGGRGVHGGGADWAPGAGGSGGGGVHHNGAGGTNVPGQGHVGGTGGYDTGGGGGAGGPGGPSAGPGGLGLDMTEWLKGLPLGDNGWFASGGSGSPQATIRTYATPGGGGIGGMWRESGSSGMPGTGGGGGGGGSGDSTGRPWGGHGGSGTVIIRHRTPGHTAPAYLGEQRDATVTLSWDTDIVGDVDVYVGTDPGAMTLAGSTSSSTLDINALDFGGDPYVITPMYWRVNDEHVGRFTLNIHGADAAHQVGSRMYFVWTNAANHVFPDPRTRYWKSVGAANAEVFVVAAGGDGGAERGAGGGAGGVRFVSFVLGDGVDYPLGVAGRSGVPERLIADYLGGDWSPRPLGYRAGAIGFDSFFGDYRATGGGGSQSQTGGGGIPQRTGGSGGGGGGSRAPGVEGQGSASGITANHNASAGGGGFSQIGGDGSAASPWVAGYGGAGINMTEWLAGLPYGDNGWFAGGGAGATGTAATETPGGDGGGGTGGNVWIPESDGLPNTGGGGGGSGQLHQIGGWGGDGIIILRVGLYETPIIQPGLGDIATDHHTEFIWGHPPAGAPTNYILNISIDGGDYFVAGESTGTTITVDMMAAGFTRYEHHAATYRVDTQSEEDGLVEGAVVSFTFVSDQYANYTLYEGGHKYYIWTETLPSHWRSPYTTPATALVVGGGGSGGQHTDSGGGGGAGGLLTGAVALVENDYYEVVIGAGGVHPQENAEGVAGENSIFGHLAAFGGGGGAGGSGRVGHPGGSGGGGAYHITISAGGAGTPGQGFHGGSNRWYNARSGGGGGAGAPGGDATIDEESITRGGVGGDGLNMSAWLSGLPFGDDGWFAGGGGGAHVGHTAGQWWRDVQGGKGGGGSPRYGRGLTAIPGMPNTGGGGAGGRYNATPAHAENASSGGSGIAVLRLDADEFFPGMIPAWETITVALTLFSWPDTGAEVYTVSINGQDFTTTETSAIVDLRGYGTHIEWSVNGGPVADFTAHLSVVGEDVGYPRAGGDLLFAKLWNISYEDPFDYFGDRVVFDFDARYNVSTSGGGFVTQWVDRTHSFTGIVAAGENIVHTGGGAIDWTGVTNHFVLHPPLGSSVGTGTPRWHTGTMVVVAAAYDTDVLEVIGRLPGGDSTTHYTQLNPPMGRYVSTHNAHFVGTLAGLLQEEVMNRPSVYISYMRHEYSPMVELGVTRIVINGTPAPLQLGGYNYWGGTSAEAIGGPITRYGTIYRILTIDGKLTEEEEDYIYNHARAAWGVP